MKKLKGSNTAAAIKQPVPKIRRKRLIVYLPYAKGIMLPKT
jgi:hypothetical protein